MNRELDLQNDLSKMDNHPSWEDTWKDIKYKSSVFECFECSSKNTLILDQKLFESRDPFDGIEMCVLEITGGQIVSEGCISKNHNSWFPNCSMGGCLMIRLVLDLSWMLLTELPACHNKFDLCELDSSDGWKRSVSAQCMHWLCFWSIYLQCKFNRVFVESMAILNMWKIYLRTIAFVQDLLWRRVP